MLNSAGLVYAHMTAWGRDGPKKVSEKYGFCNKMMGFVLKMRDFALKWWILYLK